MLTIFCRNLTASEYSKKGRRSRACSCLDGTMIRRSLGIRSWEAAQKIVREWEDGNGKLELPDVGEAMDRFSADLSSRGLSRGTSEKRSSYGTN